MIITGAAMCLLAAWRTHTKVLRYLCKMHSRTRGDPLLVSFRTAEGAN